MPTVTHTIIIPAYNEEQRLPLTLERILAFIEQEALSAEIVVVNDGSRDGTSALVRQWSYRHPIVRLLENPGNRGRGYSVRHAVHKARGDVFLYTDADLSSPIEESRRLYDALASGADIAIGSRWVDPRLQSQRQPLYRQMLGRCFNLLARNILQLPFKDTECGFKAFRRPVAQSVLPLLKMDGWGMDSEFLFVAQRQGLVIREVPVVWANDERSKVNPIADSVAQFADLLRVRANGLMGRYHGNLPASPELATGYRPDGR
ncbi:MAG TPA: dolichyl-phosphate beta-glucosyltransferase [Terriglobales bacterium]|jgi:glycosyltransferase involved in cell wall biosynthesis|nr:dolichyl-phosphate beta-glucosyltransferase [Terriglobales bacterium]